VKQAKIACSKISPALPALKDTFKLKLDNLFALPVRLARMPQALLLIMLKLQLVHLRCLAILSLHLTYDLPHVLQEPTVLQTLLRQQSRLIDNLSVKFVNQERFA
jgi:hypothetical protein